MCGYSSQKVKEIWLDEVWQGKQSKRAEEGWILIEKMYSRPELSFHNLSHVGELLAFFNSNLSLVNIQKRRALLSAIILHELGHVPQQGNSEEQTCCFLKTKMSHLIPDGLLEDVCLLIMATDPKSEKVLVGDEEIMHDLEFSVYLKEFSQILQDDQRYYDEYSAFCIKELYLFRKTEILTHFLNHQPILRVFAFRERYEVTVVENIKRLIKHLCSGQK